MPAIINRAQRKNVFFIVDPLSVLLNFMVLVINNNSIRTKIPTDKSRCIKMIY
jgi:hypothetical protein